MASQWIAILPHMILAFGGVLVFCTGAFREQRSPALLFRLSLLFATLAGMTSLFIPEAALGQMVTGSLYARFFWVLLSLITVITLLFIRHYAAARGFDGDEFYGIILFALLGMLLVTGTDHWLIFFLGLEVLSISLYILIAIHKESAPGNEAGLKYFIMGAVASAILTFGIALVYAATGTLAISRSLGEAAAAGSLPGVLLGTGFILAGIGFKVSLVPFHLWTPDVYQGAPAPVTAFLSTGSKITLFGALMAIAAHAPGALWGKLVPFFWITAALTMAVGNVTALSQTSVKRLLAYSSIAQMGYLLMALLGIKEGSSQALLFYLVAYAFMDLGAFGAVGLLSGKAKDLDRLEDYQGLGYADPFKAALLAVSLFSLAGLPPTAGLFGKLFLFQATLQAGYTILAVIGILTAIISIFFYLKVISALYMYPRTAEVPAAGGFSGSLAGSVVIAAILLLGILPAAMVNYIAHIPFFN